MNSVPILSLDAVTLGFGGRPLFADVSLSLGGEERLALVGRNGSGKSTLMKIAAGLIEPDRGTRFVQPGRTIAYLPQEPDLRGFTSLGDFAAAGLEQSERWRAEAAMEGLKLSPDIAVENASGGESRRAALARLLAGQPDLMLLDEPTNHLDIATIEWLEEYLKNTRSGFVLISHDRAFLNALSQGMVWIDRGEIRRLSQGFAAFEPWRDKTYQEEAAASHKLDRLIRTEARWAVEGISARRTRNQGRLRRLEDLRNQRRAQIARTGTAAMALASGARSGKLVIEAQNVAKSFAQQPIVTDFSLRIARGERLALVGPNGVGKTTLLRILTGDLAPDRGVVRLGANVNMALYDQRREVLDPRKSLWETLTQDKLLGVRGANDQVMVRGQPRHVAGYLKDFLFDERQARGPVGALSGGERARLLLARIMARESNLLVMDEPTNDLDIETLDLLQELLADFDGTVLLVSHDRDFIDRVASTTIAMQGDGQAIVYAGGWSDYQLQRTQAPQASPATKRPPTSSSSEPAPARMRVQEKLSYKEQRRLETLPAEIERLGTEIKRLEEFLAKPELYQSAPEKFTRAGEELKKRQDQLMDYEEEWLNLEEKRETLENRR